MALTKNPTQQLEKIKEEDTKRETNAMKQKENERKPRDKETSHG